MKNPRWALAWLVSVALSPAVAHAQGPQGNEFQANTVTTNDQTRPRVAAIGTAGDFVVVWASTATGIGSVQAHRMSSDGSAIGSEFQVNTAATWSRFASVTAAGTAGDFIVVWAGSNGDGSSYGVRGRRFDSGGNAIGSEFQVNTYTPSTQTYPSVAAIGTAGGFVVAWESFGSAGTDTSSFSVQGRVFASDGSGIGSDFQVNIYTTNNQAKPSVAATGTAGGFVVVWQSNGSGGTDSSGYSIQGRRFASDGSGLGSEFQVNTYTTSQQKRPSVAATGTAGDFVVAWQSAGADGSGSGVRGSRFASDGSGLGSEFQINKFTPNYQRAPSVATKGTSGDFVVVWQSFGSYGDTDYCVQGRRFASDGSPAMGSDFQLNTYGSGTQGDPAGTTLGSGDFAVVWHSIQDGDAYGIFGKVLHPNTVTVTAPTLTTDRWSVGSTPRIRWEHNGGASSIFRVGLSRNGGGAFSTIATAVPASTATAGNLNYLVPDDGGPYPESAQVRVRAEDLASETASSVLFSIDAAPNVTVKQPYQASLAAGSPFTIVWTQNVGYRSRMMIELTKDAGSSWSVVASLTYSQWINRGTYPWTTPASGACAPSCQIRVSWLDGVATSVSNPFVVP